MNKNIKKIYGGIMDKQTIIMGVYGLLIGDAMGVPYEFHSADEIPEWGSIDFEPPAGFARSYPDVLPGTWSDDGAQALCLLDSLLRCGRLDTRDLANRLLEWVDSGLWAVDGRVFDCGIQTMTSLRTFASGTSPLESGFAVPNGKGNGSLMRVLPLALWHEGSDLELVEDAHKQSLITHGHVCNQVCCALYCLWCRSIIGGTEVLAAYEQAVAYLREYYADKDAYLYELECCTAEGDASGSGYVVDSIRSTLYLLKTYKSYGDVIRGAISLGNDTDTTAAIAGGLAAVAYRDIPEDWVKRLRGRELLDELFQRSGMCKKLSEMTLEELWKLFPIYLTEHNGAWAQWYASEARYLSGILPMHEVAGISHIGSTSIREIWAKPIVDILVELAPGCDMYQIKNLLIKNGYLCMSESDHRISFNKGYTEAGFAERVFHLHLRYVGDNDELLFRDYLNDHPDMAKQYEELKLKLWKQYENNRDAYTEAKTDFIDGIMKLAKR